MFANDTDIIVLLISLFMEIICKNVYVGTNTSEVIDINSLRAILGEERASTLISFHCLTGCDTVGKFQGISKETWAKLFMTNDFRAESTLLNALSDFQTTVKDSILIELEKIVCWGYEKREKFSQIKTFSKARVKLYTKQKVNSDRIPPTRGSFRQHALRAFHQLRQYKTACEAFINILDPSEYGWIHIGEEFVPHTTDSEMAPNSVVQLVSCNCNKGRCTKKCKCASNDEVCTDFCGCNEHCQNSDPKMQASVLDDDVFEDEN